MKRTEYLLLRRNSHNNGYYKAKDNDDDDEEEEVKEKEVEVDYDDDHDDHDASDEDHSNWTPAIHMRSQSFCR